MRYPTLIILALTFSCGATADSSKLAVCSHTKGFYHDFKIQQVSENEFKKRGELNKYELAEKSFIGTKYYFKPEKEDKYFTTMASVIEVSPFGNITSYKTKGSGIMSYRQFRNRKKIDSYFECENL